MSNISVNNLTGVNVVFNQNLNQIEIPYDLFTFQGIDSYGEDKGFQFLIAIVLAAYNTLQGLPDPNYSVVVSKTTFAPALLGEVQKTQHTFTIDCYTDYNEPLLDPDQLI